MRAVAVFPGSRSVRMIEHPAPSISSDREVKLRMLQVGVCGTDRSLCAFEFGAAPAGWDHFILGHESLAEVVDAGDSVTAVRRGDLVVVAVRQPCADPTCAPCRAGRQDFCATGQYREHGILRLHGFMTEFVTESDTRVYRVPHELRHAAVLLEPLTIAQKAFHQFQAIDSRLPWPKDRRTALVLGAGPIGILGAMLFRNAGFETWVYSLERPDDPKTAIIEGVGCRYISSAIAPSSELGHLIPGADVVYEAMGAPQTAFDALDALGSNGVFIFTGVPQAAERLSIDLHRLLFHIILRNQAVIGTVNAGPDAFEAAIADLAAFDRSWPRAVDSLITGRYPIESFREAIHDPGIKKIIELS